MHRMAVLLGSVAVGCGPHDAGPVAGEAPPPAAAPAKTDAAAGHPVDHAGHLRAFCARVTARDEAYLRAHVQLPLVRWHNVVGDRCSAGAVPCDHRPISIADPAALVRAQPCDALDPAGPFVDVGTAWVIGTTNQMSDWLWFTSLPDGSARLVRWDDREGPQAK